jgi:hypothetical protein
VQKGQLQRTIDAIVRMGFRKAHVEEAATLHKGAVPILYVFFIACTARLFLRK